MSSVLNLLPRGRGKKASMEERDEVHINASIAEQLISKDYSSDEIWWSKESSNLHSLVSCETPRN